LEKCPNCGQTDPPETRITTENARYIYCTDCIEKNQNRLGVGRDVIKKYIMVLKVRSYLVKCRSWLENLILWVLDLLENNKLVHEVDLFSFVVEVRVF
jgi:hypothetical protein